MDFVEEYYKTITRHDPLYKVYSTYSSSIPIFLSTEKVEISGIKYKNGLLYLVRDYPFMGKYQITMVIGLLGSETCEQVIFIEDADAPRKVLLDIMKGVHPGARENYDDLKRKWPSKDDRKSRKLDFVERAFQIIMGREPEYFILNKYALNKDLSLKPKSGLLYKLTIEGTLKKIREMNLAAEKEFNGNDFFETDNETKYGVPIFGTTYKIELSRPFPFQRTDSYQFIQINVKEQFPMLSIYVNPHSPAGVSRFLLVLKTAFSNLNFEELEQQNNKILESQIAIGQGIAGILVNENQKLTAQKIQAALPMVCSIEDVEILLSEMVGIGAVSKVRDSPNQVRYYATDAAIKKFNDNKTVLEGD